MRRTSAALIRPYAIVSRMLERNRVSRHEDHLLEHHRGLVDSLRQRAVQKSKGLLAEQFKISEDLIRAS